MIGYKYIVEELDRTNKTFTIKPSDILLEYFKNKDYIEWESTSRKERNFKLCQR